MNKRELLEAIKDVPDNMDIFIEKTDDEFHLSGLNSATVKLCTFSDGKLKGKENCLVLSDEF